MYYYIKLFYIFLLTCTLATLSDSKRFRFDYGYYPKADGWLKLHRVPATWHDAWLRCHLEGAVLASPINIHLEASLRSMMRYHRSTWDGIFSGIHATFSKGDFFSVEGVPLNRMPVEWMPSEPDNKNNDENCILYVDNGTIADVNCNNVLPYACYKKNTNNVILNECGTVDKDYTLDPRTGSCYKFHRVARNWTRAFMTCTAEGGHLAIINSHTEANVLRELFAKYPQNSIQSNIPGIMREIVHLGFLDWRERGVWTTIHGTSLKEAGFDIFSDTQPDNAPPGEYCGGMFRNGLLDDVWCHERGPFICEKDPNSLIADDEDDEENI